LFDGKVKLVGALKKSKLSVSFSRAQGKIKKLRKNGNFNAKSVFDKIDLDFWCR